MRQVCVLAGILFLLLPVSGRGQEPGSLERVEALIAQGRILQAREVLEDWWEERGPDVGRLERQRSLWLRARLTVDPSLADLDLRRLVLEFPGGPFSDDALLRLAQSAESRGDLREAFSHYTALVRGYPGSPLVPRARAWIENNGADVRAQGGEAQDREIVPDSGRAGVAATAPEAHGRFSVQLGAFRSVENARALADDLQRAGFQARVVRVVGDTLTRVRVGRFQLRDGADELRRTLEASGFEATIVTDAQSEERVR